MPRGQTTMAPINAASAPIASTGLPQVSGAPVPGAQATPTTNQSSATSFGPAATSTPAASPTGYQSFAAPVAGAQATPGATASTFSPAPAVTGGGVVGDAIGALASFAQNKMQEIQGKIGALFKSDGGQPDMAAVQFLNTQMTTMVWVSEQAAKMEEKRERAMQVWVR